jgi:hypothetical protein
MNRNKLFRLTFLLIFPWIAACCDKDNPAPDDKRKLDLPIVFVHGALASGDTYATQFQRFSSYDYPENLMFAFDWNTLSQGNAQGLLDQFIDSVLTRTGKSQIVLVGHSAGSGLGYGYCSDSTRAGKVSRYIHLAGNKQSRPAGPSGNIPTLNIWSAADLIVPGDSMPGAENVKYTDLDHYQVATHPQVFGELYRFITGESPAGLSVRDAAKPLVGGRVVTLGENAATTGTLVRIFRVDPATGLRLNSNPDTTLSPDASGWWGPFPASSGSRYEFEVTRPGDANFRTVHYYRVPFLRNNPWVYLRVFPGAGSTISFLLASLPKNDNQSVLAFFSSSQAVINGRDELQVSGQTLSLPNLTAPNQSTIAMFLYDDGDQLSSLKPVGLFSAFPFLKAADMYFQTTSPSSIELRFNGRSLFVRNWKSASEGVVIPVFD